LFFDIPSPWVKKVSNNTSGHEDLDQGANRNTSQANHKQANADIVPFFDLFPKFHKVVEKILGFFGSADDGRDTKAAARERGGKGDYAADQRRPKPGPEYSLAKAEKGKISRKNKGNGNQEADTEINE
jgi:hypothetical protein